MKLSQTCFNITNNNGDVIYVSNGTINAVSSVIESLPRKFNMGLPDYEIVYLKDNKLLKFNQYGNYIKRTVSILSNRFLNNNKLDYENIDMKGFNPLGLNSYPEYVEFGPSGDFTESNIQLREKIDAIIETIEQNNHHDVVIIDSLANLSSLKSGKSSNALINAVNTVTLHHVPHISVHPKMNIEELLYCGFDNIDYHEDTMIKEKPIKIRKNSIYGKIKNRSRKGR